MRIVGGRHRGTALASVGSGDKDARLRPTSDRVREAMFNLLAHGDYGGEEKTGFTGNFEDIRVLDLFAGTGALGFEALSRGAGAVVFVDDGAKARALIRRNIDILRAIGPTKLLRRDAVRLGPVKGLPFDLIFADPPYGRGLGVRAIEAAQAGGWLAPGSVIVMEEGVETPPPPGFRAADTRRYGDTWVHIWQQS
ncbi:MAG: 16S rRNA (guanine(966)-N(2))-methyltransferase RsmD [Pseudomonadota bacterium]